MKNHKRTSKRTTKPGHQQIPLPFPNYVVFYNGTADEPERTTLLLSQSFQIPEHTSNESPALDPPALKCRATVLNINRGHNLDLMNRCKRLWEYAEFIGEIQENLKKGLRLEKATREYLRKEAIELGRKEGLELGLKDGLEQGLEQGKKAVAFNLYNRHFSLEDIAQICEVSVTQLQGWAKEWAPSAQATP